jgi:hypothetical protein
MRVIRWIARMPKAGSLVGLAGLLAIVPATPASGQDQQDLANALQNLFRSAESQEGESPPPPVAVPARGLLRPGVPVQEAGPRGPDFVLLGVVIAEDRRMALLGDGASGTRGAHLLHLGDTFRQHRVADVQPDRVVLERGDGEQVIVRLGATMGSNALPTVRPEGPATPAPAAPSRASGGAESRPWPIVPAGREQAGSAPSAPAQPVDRRAKKQLEREAKLQKREKKGRGVPPGASAAPPTTSEAASQN